MIFRSITLAVLVLAFSGMAQAEIVGRFSQVEGQVELLKGGKAPAVAVKPEDGVEPGDAVHTKDRSRAQVKLLDDSTLTISPNSRIIIEQCLFDEAKSQRQASVQVLQGLMQTVVTRIFKVKEPDFVVKTADAVMGVRGTEWYVLKGADTDFTDAFARTGKISVRMVAPAQGRPGPERPYPPVRSADLEEFFRQAGKIAFAGPGIINLAQRGLVLLGPMQTSRTVRGQVPTPPMNFTMAELRLLQRTARVGLPPRLAPSTNPRNLLQQIRPFIERQEKAMKTGKADKTQELAKKIKEALDKGENLSAIMKGLMDQGEKIGEIMAAATEAGLKDSAEIANAAMAAGANLAEVRAALAAAGYAGADAYTYTPPAPPAPPAGPGPTFPGGGGGGAGGGAGGGGAGGGGGGGGVASPSE
ncbi:MAG: FecR family protein [Thermodesulfobacteriota bacterium]